MYRRRWAALGSLILLLGCTGAPAPASAPVAAPAPQPEPGVAPVPDVAEAPPVEEPPAEPPPEPPPETPPVPPSIEDLSACADGASAEVVASPAATLLAFAEQAGSYAFRAEPHGGFAPLSLLNERTGHRWDGVGDFLAWSPSGLRALVRLRGYPAPEYLYVDRHVWVDLETGRAVDLGLAEEGPGWRVDLETGLPRQSPAPGSQVTFTSPLVPGLKLTVLASGDVWGSAFGHERLLGNVASIGASYERLAITGSAHVALATAQGEGRLWDARSDTLVELGPVERAFAASSGASGLLALVRPLPDGTRTLSLYDAVGGGERVLLTSRGEVREAKFSPDGAFVVVTHSELEEVTPPRIALWRTTRVQLFRTGSGEEVVLQPRQELVLGDGYFGSMAFLTFFSPDGGLLQVGIHDEALGVFEVATGARIQVLTRAITSGGEGYYGFWGPAGRTLFDPEGGYLTDVYWELYGWDTVTREERFLGRNVATDCRKGPLLALRRDLLDPWSREKGGELAIWNDATQELQAVARVVEPARCASGAGEPQVFFRRAPATETPLAATPLEVITAGSVQRLATHASSYVVGPREIAYATGKALCRMSRP